MEAKSEIKKKELTQSERFTQMVVREFGNKVSVGKSAALSKFQERLVQNYFIHTDIALKKAKTPIKWDQVNMVDLAISVVAAAKVGLDPAQNNHINMIPYHNSKTGKYDINFMLGYAGIELKAKKYGLDVPDHVVVELVFSTDKFKMIKRDVNNPIESYEFEVTNSFNRGDVIGGFYYYAYTDTPEKNKLMVYNLAEIEKRKPKYAAAEFWGGTNDEWVNNKKTGKKVKVEGWLNEMLWKTIKRAAFNNITIDAQKIDDEYNRLSQYEKTQYDLEESEANTEEISFDEVVEEHKEIPEKEKERIEIKEQPDPKEYPMTEKEAANVIFETPPPQEGPGFE